MKHIFYLHSNICAIVSHGIISDLVRNNEEVVVVSERKTIFPSFKDQIKVYDIQQIIDTYRKKDQKLIGHVINYRFDLIPQLRKFAKDVIGDQEFILYLPSCNMFTIQPFFKSKYCSGYYFIEEGTLSYLSKEKLKQRYYTSKYKKGLFLLDFFNMGIAYEFKVTNKFRGCICLSDKAYPWCSHDLKTFVNIKDSLAVFEYKNISTDVVITTDYLRRQKENYLDAFDFVINKVMSENPSYKIYVKFHPTAYLFEETKMNEIIDYLKEKYGDIIKGFLLPSYLMEGLLCDNKVCLYSIFCQSSLLLYALVFGSKAFVVEKDNNDITINEIANVNNFLEISNN